MVIFPLHSEIDRIKQPTLPNNGPIIPSPSPPANPGVSHKEHEEGGHGFDANRIIAEDEVRDLS